MTEEEYTLNEYDRHDDTKTDYEIIPPDTPVAPDHSELNKYTNDAFISKFTGTTEDTSDPTDPGPTSGPKFTTSKGEGDVIDRKKGNTTGPSLMVLGKRKRRRTVRRTKGRKTNTTRSYKSVKSRKSHSKRKRSRRTNKTYKSRK